MQLDESPDVSNTSQLTVFARFSFESEELSVRH